MRVLIIALLVALNGMVAMAQFAGNNAIIASRLQWSGGGAWVPPQSDSLEVWLDADNPGGYPAGATFASASPATNDYEQSNATKRGTITGGVLVLDGTDDYLTSVRTNLIHGSTNWTISMWVKVTAYTKFDRFWDLTGNQNRLFQNNNNTNNQVTIIGTGKAFDFSYNEWHHILQTCDNVSQRHTLWLDGNLYDGSAANIGAAISVVGSWYLGAYWDGGTFALGAEIDDYMMWQSCLSSNQVVDLYNNTGQNE